jgi:hypothetical protein
MKMAVKKTTKLAIGLLTTDRETVSNTLLSLFFQTYKEYDLFIFDNGNLPCIHEQSINNLIDLHSSIRKVSYERIRNIRQVPQSKQYVLNSLNYYEYVLLSDDDNIFETDYVEKLINVLETNKKISSVEGVHVLINNANGHTDYSFEKKSELIKNEKTIRHYLYNFDKTIITKYNDYSSTMYRIKDININLLSKLKGLAGGGYLISRDVTSALRTGAICYENNNKNGSNWKNLMFTTQEYVVNNIK